MTSLNHGANTAFQHANLLRYENPFIRRAPRTEPRVRLFCFPYAGAGASAFSEWPALFPPEVEVIAVQLPGREDRIHEQPFSRVTPLIRALTQVMRPYFDLPFAFFGHSGGAALAFELSRALRQRLRTEPSRLFLAGHRAPTAPRPELLHTLPEQEFSRRISELGGMDATLLADERSTRLFMSVVRADFELWESHEFAESPPLTSAITVFGGMDDPRARPADLDAWRDQTTGRFTLHLFTGGHFFVRADQPELVGRITAELTADQWGEDDDTAGEG
jgi:medium-chain acyl-[acyl-carrier-protein] hydrolase